MQLTLDIFPKHPARPGDTMETSMKVRPIQHEDAPELIRLAKAAHQESDYADIPFNNGSVMELILACIADVDYHGSVVELHGELIGFMAAFVSPFMFSRAKFTMDVVLYVVPNRRNGLAAMKMIKDYEQWARAQGVVDMKLGVSSGIDQERTCSFYERLGYRQISYLFKKENVK